MAPSGPTRRGAKIGTNSVQNRQEQRRLVKPFMQPAPPATVVYTRNTIFRATDQIIGYERMAYRSTLASPTRNAQSLGKLIPICAANSGMSDVGVMPG